MAMTQRFSIQRVLGVVGVAAALGLTGPAMADEDDAELLTMDAAELEDVDDPCAFFVRGARLYYDDVHEDDQDLDVLMRAVDIDPYWQENPETSADHILSTTALEAIDNGASADEAASATLEECRTFEPDFLVGDARYDADPERIDD